MRSILIGVSLVTISLTAVATPAKAGFVLYTNRAAFEAATTNRTVIDFEGITNQSHWYGNSTGSAFGGVTFTESSGRLFVLTPSAYGTSGTTAYLTNALGRSPIIATFAEPHYAVGMDIGQLFNSDGASSGSIVVSIPNGPALGLVGPGLAGTSLPLTFFGWVSDTPFSSVEFYSTLGSMIDNFTFGERLETTAVPAPGSAMLLGVGMTSLAGFRAVRGKKPAVVAA